MRRPDLPTIAAAALLCAGAQRVGAQPLATRLALRPVHVGDSTAWAPESPVRVAPLGPLAASIARRDARRTNVRARYALVGAAAGAALGALTVCHFRCGEGTNARTFLPVLTVTGAALGGVVGFVAGGAVARRAAAGASR
jgi:hypothetical protein